MVRFLLYSNEWDIEGIITSRSQYHWQGHRWAGDDWIKPYLDAYAQVYPNLVRHDPAYPAPEYLREHTALGNVKSEGEMDEVTAGSQLIVRALLDGTDDRPIWLQAWGGPNTIARALRSIEEDHPERMAEVARKIRFFFIWEQDSTYQEYIRPHWGAFGITTIISDQFEAIAYRWKNCQPKEMLPYFAAAWMKQNILENHGPLCSLYKAHTDEDEGFDDGDFRSEGDSPAFMHQIVTGLQNLESPDWGGWGGRYVRVRENTWLDPVPIRGYVYPEGRWYTATAWGRNSLKKGATAETDKQRREYFKPIWRWSPAFQNDFAARADWCVKDFKDANHAPVAVVVGDLQRNVKAGDTVKLTANVTDPDNDRLTCKWWQYAEADSATATVTIDNRNSPNETSFVAPNEPGKQVHVILEVTDDGTPPLVRYQRIVCDIQ